jgi:hypothetical protein
MLFDAVSVFSDSQPRKADIKIIIIILTSVKGEGEVRAAA